MTNRKEKIGLYSGSFNPIHIGHLILANYIVENTDLDKIWFVLSPQNPLKKQTDLLADDIRYDMMKKAVEDNSNFIASDVELFLPKPSYTINTLNYLSKQYTQNEFSLIMGEDNLANIDKWKDYQKILSLYNIYVYPRENCQANQYYDYSKVHLLKAPLLNISASYIREQIKKGKSIQYLVPQIVKKAIEEKELYKSATK